MVLVLHPLRFLLLVPGHGDISRFPFLRESIEKIQESFAKSYYFAATDLRCVIYTYRAREEYDLEAKVYGRRTSNPLSTVGDFDGTGETTVTKSQVLSSAESFAGGRQFSNRTGVHHCEIVRRQGLHYQEALWAAHMRFTKQSESSPPDVLNHTRKSPDKKRERVDNDCFTRGV